ncbi:T9SS type A sorting domain-containing protein [Flavobacterium sp. 3HN19-14]|uniref:T9SS type A sorting domain-containing protein n=1 Tax=Flavobacterium sp. 3HN19-14 TaxID=3448133 RepID=UPI003EE37F2C
MPAAYIVSTSGDICFGDTATFCISGTPFADVTYSIDGVLSTVVLDPSGTACIVVIANSGSIVIELISITSSGTPSCTSILSGTAVVNVNALPQIQLASQYTIGVQNGTVTSPVLLDTQLSESTYTFQWYLDGEIIAGATGATYLVNTVSDSENPRQYTVSVNAIGTSCQSIASCLVTQPMLGVADMNISDVKFGPNPFSQNLVVKAKEAIQNISISNLRGQIVYSQKYNTSEVSINTSDLSAATYFVKVTSMGKQQTFKVVKQ